MNKSAMHSPEVSIIVPVYNAKDYLQKCLDSILSQTFVNIEVICVNDGSTDESLSILDYYKACDPRIKLIDIENRGVSNARNVALRQAKGKCVLFVDSDDWIDSFCLEKLVNFANVNDCDVVMFPYMSERPGITLKRELFHGQKVFSGSDCSRIARRIIGPIGPEIVSPSMLDSYATIWGKLYRRNAIMDIEFVDLSLIGSAEDTLFNIIAFKRFKTIGYTPVTYYHYRQNNNNSLTTKGDPVLSEKRKTMFAILEELLTNDDEKKALKNRIALGVLGVLINEFAFPRRLERMKRILSDPVYSNALQSLETKYMLFHWRFFFFCAKKRWSKTIIVLIYFIQKIRQK